MLRAVRVRATPTEELLADVIRIALRIGHVPTRRQYDSAGRYGAYPLSYRMGGWNVVKSAVRDRVKRLYPNKMDDSPDHLVLCQVSI